MRGLDLGADDYVPKPFALAEVIARVGAQVRRARMDRGDGETLRVPTASASTSGASSPGGATRRSR